MGFLSGSESAGFYRFLMQLYVDCRWKFSYQEIVAITFTVSSHNIFVSVPCQDLQRHMSLRPLFLCSVN